MMNIKRKLSVKLAKLLNGKHDDTITSEERCLMIIVKKLLNIQESDLLMTPNMNKIYIKSDDSEIFVCVDFVEDTASVINHKFGYDLKLSKHVLNYVNDNFSKEVEKRRMDMENEYRGNIQYSLSNVIQKLYKHETYTNS